MNITDQSSLDAMSTATDSNIVAVERVSHTVKKETLRDFYVGYQEQARQHYLMVQPYHDKNRFTPPVGDDYTIIGPDGNPVDALAPHKIIEKAFMQRLKRGEKIK